MKRLLEVREFDRISCNPDFKTEYAYLPESVFRDLEDFIHAFAGGEEHADALEFLKISFRRNVGDIISVNNYVGLIQMHDGYQIQVLPKIDYDACKVEDVVCHYWKNLRRRTRSSGFAQLKPLDSSI